MSITCFINLDGVLHPAATFIDSKGQARVLMIGKAPFQWAQRIAKVAKREGLEFVICSPWLHRMSLQRLRDQAPPWMRPRIVGGCKQFADLGELQYVHRHASAWSAIDAYVQARGIENWLAVDCIADGWPSTGEARDRLVLCDPKTGLGNQLALRNFDDAVLRESRLAAEHYSASLVVSLHAGCPVAVQERWHLDFWLRSPDSPTPAFFAFFDEQAGSQHFMPGVDGLDGGEYLATFALQALGKARFKTPTLAVEWRPHYRWNRVAFAVESAGPLPIGRSWLRVVVEIREDECRVCYRREDGCVESFWQLRAEEDAAPMSLLARALKTIVDTA